MKFLYFLALLPIIVMADEAQIQCDLVNSQTKSQTSILEMPAAFVSFGDPSVSQKSIAVGISQSISGIVRANDLNKSAEAQCRSFQSALTLDENERWAIIDIEKRGWAAEISSLTDAINLEKENINLLTEQLKAGVVTTSEIILAEQQLKALEIIKTNALVVLTTPVPAYTTDNLKNATAAYISSQADSAMFTSKSIADSGWDISIEIGKRKSIDTPFQEFDTSTSTFAALSFKYSFGSVSAFKATSDVRKNTEKLLSIQHGGFNQEIDRLRHQINDMLSIEKHTIEVDTTQLSMFNALRIPLDQVDSILSMNAKRTLDIQIKAINADIEGANARLVAVQELISSLGTN